MIRYREHRPTTALRSRIECIWTASDPTPRRDRPPEHIVPDACPELIVHLGDRFERLSGSRWVRQPRAFLAGTLSRPWMLRAGARVHTLGIRFRPGTVTSFFALEMSDATDREIDLGALAGVRVARDLVRRLTAAPDPASRVRAAAAWLLELPTIEGGPGREVTRRTVEWILRGRGQDRIEAIAREIGVTRRRIERRFARDLGIRPKLFARIVRLNAALAGLGGAGRARAVDVALEAGYFDQAHLSRDFRAVAGRRAGAPRGRDGEMARHFTRPDRLLALLAGE